MPPSDSPIRSWRRRDVIKTLGATALTLPALFPASPAKGANAKVIKIGHVSPKTGPLAPFAEADPFILDQVRGVLAKGIANGGVTYAVEIISADSQSKTNRASEVAAVYGLHRRQNEHTYETIRSSESKQSIYSGDGAFVLFRMERSPILRAVALTKFQTPDGSSAFERTNGVSTPSPSVFG